MNVLINDLSLLKACEKAIAENSGNEIPEIGDVFPTDKCVCFGERYSDGDPLWVVVLYNFNKRHDCLIDLYLNLKGTLTPSLVNKIGRVIGNYAFEQAGLTRISSTVRASNKSAMRINRHFGFKEEGVVRQGFLPPIVEDKHLFGMLKSDCRWV